MACMQPLLMASGVIRMQALAVPVLRRHSRSSADSQEAVSYSPPVRVVSGNYVTGMRRGIVDGVDFGSTGKVRGVQVGPSEAGHAGFTTG